MKRTSVKVHPVTRCTMLRLYLFIDPLQHRSRLGSKRSLPPKMPFFVRQKMQILSKILPKIPNFVIFCHPKSSTCYDKWTPNNFSAKNGILRLSKSENLVNFVKNQYFRHYCQLMTKILITFRYFISFSLKTDN